MGTLFFFTAGGKTFSGFGTAMSAVTAAAGFSQFLGGATAALLAVWRSAVFRLGTFVDDEPVIRR